MTNINIDIMPSFFPALTETLFMKAFRGEGRGERLYTFLTLRYDVMCILTMLMMMLMMMRTRS